MSRRRSGPFVGIAVDAEDVPFLWALLRDGVRRARFERWTLSADQEALLSSLEQMASAQQRRLSSASGLVEDVTSAVPRPRLTVKEASALLERADRTVVDMIHDGVLDGRMVGGRWQIDAGDVYRQIDIGGDRRSSAADAEDACA
ncbi:MAG: hypothetical protein JWN67_422 [Actinomycetia bacterium]|nr:hypothetical protein [Actinomycetes bacterium]